MGKRRSHRAARRGRRDILPKPEERPLCGHGRRVWAAPSCALGGWEGTFPGGSELLHTPLEAGVSRPRRGQTAVA